jgi:hypothetical protein
MSLIIPSEVGLEGNKLGDEQTHHAVLNGAVFDRPLLPVDYQGLARSVLLREWHGSGRFRH